jgi:hypothetical protein
LLFRINQNLAHKVTLALHNPHNFSIHTATAFEEFFSFLSDRSSISSTSLDISYLMADQDGNLPGNGNPFFPPAYNAQHFPLNNDAAPPEFHPAKFPPNNPPNPPNPPNPLPNLPPNPPNQQLNIQYIVQPRPTPMPYRTD